MIYFLILSIFNLSLVACSTLSTSNDRQEFSKLESIPFYSAREDIAKKFGKPSYHADHDNGTAWYYDEKVGHYEMPIMNFTFNKSGKLVGKSWRCQQDCKVLAKKLFLDRQPAGNFTKQVPMTGRKSVYGPNERLLIDKLNGMVVEIEGDKILAIHWDRPESTYLYRQPDPSSTTNYWLDETGAANGKYLHCALSYSINQ